MRLLRWLGLAAVGTIVLGMAALSVSSRLSLDGEYAHTQEARALPALSTGTTSGLVQIRARDLSFRARVAGLDGDGPALLLLHGFPETSIMWSPLIEAAGSAGYRVVAFDQRGYSPLARPEGIEAYRVSELVADVFAVADAVGFERFHLVGHDWGSIVGWAAAGRERERILSYVSLSIPHPGAIAAANEGRTPPLYVRVFRTPLLPETLFTAGGLAAMRDTLYASMPEEQVDEYIAVFSEPGALRAALNWYRAMPQRFLADDGLADSIAQPVLYVFGNEDLPVFTRKEVRDLQPRFVTGPYQQIELQAGHWLIQESPTQVVAAVMSHLGAYARGEGAGEQGR